MQLSQFKGLDVLKIIIFIEKKFFNVKPQGSTCLSGNILLKGRRYY